MSEDLHTLVQAALAKVVVPAKAHHAALPESDFAALKLQFAAAPPPAPQLHALVTAKGLFDAGLELAGRQFVALAEAGLGAIGLEKAARANTALAQAFDSVKATMDKPKAALQEAKKGGFSAAKVKSRPTR